MYAKSLMLFMKFNGAYYSVHGTMFYKSYDNVIRNHYENTPIQIYWNFHHQKNENFQIKNSDIFSYFC